MIFAFPSIGAKIGRSAGAPLEGQRLAVQDLLDDGVELDDGPGLGDGLRRGLAGLVDEEGGALIEDAARGCVVLFGPCGEPVPGVDAPAVVALDDERGVAPARRGGEGGEDAAEDAVGKREIVEVGAVAALGVVAVDAAPDVGAVGDGEVEEDEVGLVGVEQLEGVLLEVGLGDGSGGGRRRSRDGGRRGRGT
jgi:hypothetical protein